MSDTPNVRPVSHYAKRLRARIGLWLVRPWLHHRKRTAYWHAVKSDKPHSYHEDWWLGQFFALEHLEQDLDRGRPL